MVKNILQDAGLPSDAVAAIQRLVAGAGYDVDDPGDLTLGMTAVMATLRVCDALHTRRVPRGGRVGRNDPCPCGSGKKHKKCCLQAGAPGQGPERYDPGDPLERPDLVPRIHDAESLAGDLGELEALFQRAETLRGVRFTPDRLVAFVLAEPPEEEPPPPPDDSGEDDLGGEERVARYLREVEGAEVLGNLGRALLRAARYAVVSDQDLRSVAAGVALWEMEAITGGEDGGDAPNPLLSMLFWLTLRETVASISTLDAVARERFPADFFSKPKAAGRLQALGHPPLPPHPGVTEPPALRDLAERIRDGRFPVGMPLLSALPAWVRLSLLDPDRARPEEVAAALQEGAEALGPEDAELMDQALELWWEDEADIACLQDRAAVGDARMFLAEGAFGALGPDFVLDAVRHRSCFSLRGEPGLPDRPVTRPSEVFTPEYLEACGDFLQDCDLPEMALRTWQLCGLLGPVPEAVGGKVAALQRELAEAGGTGA
jgi:hypothetical protein